MWSAKSLHELVLGFYPGRQHYAAHDRRRRDRPNEYCGCGGDERYGACCRPGDQARSAFSLWAESSAAKRQYLCELAEQGRAIQPRLAVSAGEIVINHRQGRLE
jgi:hypothetical protein